MMEGMSSRTLVITLVVASVLCQLAVWLVSLRSRRDMKRALSGASEQWRADSIKKRLAARQPEIIAHRVDSLEHVIEGGRIDAWAVRFIAPVGILLGLVAAIIGAV